MENLPTAEEIMQKHLDPHDCLRISKCYEMTLDTMIEFAKLHVELALKEAIKCLPYDDRLNRDIMVSQAIETCYPLENIK
jgi:hypothetical protein